MGGYARARRGGSLCEPLPFSPSVSPQSSSIVHSLRGATNSRIWPGGPPSAAGASNVWPMKCVAYGAPEQ